MLYFEKITILRKLGFAAQASVLLRLHNNDISAFIPVDSSEYTKYKTRRKTDFGKVLFFRIIFLAHH